MAQGRQALGKRPTDCQENPRRRVHCVPRSRILKVSFAKKRPSGSYALAIPVWGEDMLADRLAGLDEAGRKLAARAADAQRFEREAATIAETFVEEGDAARRLLLIGLGGKR